MCRYRSNPDDDDDDLVPEVEEEEQPYPLDPQQVEIERSLDENTLHFITVGGSEGLHIPTYIRSLSPNAMKKTGGGFTKPELSWSLYRLWEQGKVRFLPLQFEVKESDDSKLLSSKGKGAPKIGHVKLSKFVKDQDGLIPQRPAKPGLPRRNWPLTVSEYLGKGSPLVVAYGVGVDSTAILVEFARLGIRPHAILFADLGSEKPETGWYLEKVMKPWLKKQDFPEVTKVRYEMTAAGIARRATEGGVIPKGYTTLEENCFFNFDLPSWAYGFQRHSCSDKWKVKPQEAWITKSPDFAEFAWEYWKKKLPVIRVIGFDAGKHDSGRRWKIKDDIHFMHWYPLIDWKWERKDCEAAIKRAGLPVPVKSACYFCPSSTPQDIEQLTREHPDLADRIIQMEKGARPFLGGKPGQARRQKFKATGEYPDLPESELPDQGLWYRGKPGEGKPGRMGEFIQEYRRLCLLDPGNPRCKDEDGKRWKPGPEYAHLAKGIPFLPLKRRLPILREL